MENLLTDVLRTLIWWILKAFFWAMDNIYQLTMDVSKLEIWTTFVDVNGNSVVEQWWKVGMMFLASAVFLRLIVFIFSSFMSPEKKLNNINFPKRIIMIVMVFSLVGMIPIIMRGIGSYASNLNSNVMAFVGMESDTMPSTLLLSGGSGLESGYWEIDSSGNRVYHAEVVTVTLDDIKDINEHSQADTSQYLFFNDTSFMFVTLFVAIYACILFFMIALDIGKRWLEIIVLIIFSFIPISSLILDDNNFSDWGKMILSVYLSNYSELYIMIITMVLVMLMKDMNVMVQILMLIAGLLFSLNGSQTLSRLLGIETSGNTLQQLAYLSQVGRPLAAGVHMAGRAIGGAARGVRNQSVLAMGAALGGVGTANYGKMQSSYSSSVEYGQDGSKRSYEAEYAGKDNFTYSNIMRAGKDGELREVRAANMDAMYDWKKEHQHEIKAYEEGQRQQAAQSGTGTRYAAPNNGTGGSQFQQIKNDGSSHATAAGTENSDEMIGTITAFDAKNGPRPSSIHNFDTRNAVRNDTYSEAQIWKDGSRMDRWQKNAFKDTSRMGAVKRMAWRTTSRMYENQLRRVNAKRYRY